MDAFENHCIGAIAISLLVPLSSLPFAFGSSASSTRQIQCTELVVTTLHLALPSEQGSCAREVPSPLSHLFIPEQTQMLQLSWHGHRA